MKLYDCAKTIRSKNAGPFTLTIDLVFDDQSTFYNILHDLQNRKSEIARLYSVAPQDIHINSLIQVNAIKISMPRSFASSGGLNDRDVYGCQQHFPLAEMQIQ